MRRVKHVLCLMSILTLGLLITGCTRVEESITVKSNGAVDVTASFGIRKEFFEQMNDSSGPSEDYTLETIDGKEYYVTKETETTTLEEMSKDSSSIQLTKNIFVINPSNDMEDIAQDHSSQEDADLNGMFDFYCVQITLPSAIVETNGTKVNDYTVRWEYSPDNKTALQPKWYAYTAEGKNIIESDKTAPTLSGVKNNAYYKSVIDYSNYDKKGSLALNKITATDNSGIVYITLNGKDINNVNSSSLNQGKNTLTASDLSGNTTTYTFYYDSFAPVVKGIKNKKTYKKSVTVYVKDAVSLNKVTVNGKKVKLSKQKSGKYKGYSKYKIKKKGKNKVIAYDKAGNKKTITVRIR